MRTPDPWTAGRAEEPEVASARPRGPKKFLENLKRRCENAKNVSFAKRSIRDGRSDGRASQALTVASTMQRGS